MSELVGSRILFLQQLLQLSLEIAKRWLDRYLAKQNMCSHKKRRAHSQYRLDLMDLTTMLLCSLRYGGKILCKMNSLSLVIKVQSEGAS